LRVRDEATNQQFPAADPRGDLANAFSSRVHGDPFTPILPAYEKDQTVVRLIQGAQEEQHVFNLHGYKWFFQPGTPEDPASVNNSGYRNGQQIGISEHFEFYLNQPPAPDVPPATTDSGATKPYLIRRRFVDHLYSSAATDNLWDGQWGILRVYNSWQTGGVTVSDGGDTPAGAPAPASQQESEVTVADPADPDANDTIRLARLPNNPAPTSPPPEYQGTTTAASGPNTIIEPPQPEIQPVCPEVQRKYGVTAILARDLLPSHEVVYNKRSRLVDPNAILLVNDEQLGELKEGTREPEPLILRAAAGECVEVTLTNNLPDVPPENNSWNMMPMIVERFNFNQVRTSNRVGLHSQLVAVNTYLDDGASVGFNPDSTAAPNGGTKTYRWYAGDRYGYPDGTVQLTPIEFGSTGIRDMGDAIKHASHGSIGALVIEPLNSNWKVDPLSNAAANIYDTASGSQIFREFVVLYQTDLSLQQRGSRGGFASGLKALRNMADTDDSEDSGMKAFNYKTEPLWGRLGVPITTPPIGGPDHPGPSINDFDLTNILSSTQPNPGCGPACGDPETPIFEAQSGQAVRFRVLDVAGHPRQHGFTIFGHHWQFEPWQNHSRIQGNNPFTFEIGSESGIAPTRHVNILTTAGGIFGKPGDYLYRTQEAMQFTYGGLWGIFRVASPPPGPCDHCKGDPSCDCNPPADYGDTVLRPEPQQKQ
ncbi:MAG: hypothetical protein H0T60_09380, partial [Acidobacteria bacterium]|nr:hypothetical protein [Acidobacteriota bacterium]